MWEALVSQLGKSLANEEAILIGNFLVNGKELDALLVRRKSISVIELKHYKGLIHFSENDHWYADEAVVRGGNQRNPFHQVRNNKFAVLERLSASWLPTGGNGHRTPHWGHISGMVVFSGPAVFDERLPGSISPWFHITDLDSIAEKVASLSSPDIDLNAEEIRKCSDLIANVLAAPNPSRLSILYHRQSDFNRAIRDLRAIGLSGTIAANLFFGFQETIKRGEDPFRALRYVDRDEVKNLRVFTLGECSLAVVVIGKTYCLGTIGLPADVETWIELHRGLEFLVDFEAKKILTTRVQGVLEHLPTHATGDAKPYLERVEGINLVEMGVRPFLAKILNSINEDSSAEEVGSILGDTPNPDDQAFLAEVFELLRVGEQSAAQARVDLRNGTAAPAESMPETLATAIDSIENSDTIIDLATLGEEEWARIFEPGRFHEWMVFLHPGQKRVVEEDFPGPAILTGVSGSGKTCVLVHRARRMAWKYENATILVLTLNRSLAALINNLVVRVCSASEAPRIEVKSFHDYVSELMTGLDAERFLKDYGAYTNHRKAIAELLLTPPPGGFAAIFKALDERELRSHFHDFIKHLDGKGREAYYELSKYLTPKDPDLDVPHYLYEELELIRSAFPCYENYLDYRENYEREGRMIPLDKRMRERVLRLLHDWEEYQLDNRFLDHMGLCQAALLAVDEMAELPLRFRHRCVLVDEFQDFSTMDFRLLRKIPTAEENGLFIAGDFAQKLYAKELEFGKVAMGTGARTLRSIQKNYRNSKQILLAADRLLREWPPVIGRDVELAILKPEMADRESACPIALRCRNPIAQAWKEAQQWLSQGHVAFSVCIASADPEHLPVEEILAAKPAELEADALTGDYMLAPSRVIVSDIAAIKGFEFSLIIVLGLEEGAYPPKGRQVNERWRDALRLYVAITRGRDEVRFLYSGKPSPFLAAMAEMVSWQDSEDLDEPLEVELATSISVSVPVSSQDDRTDEEANGFRGNAADPERRNFGEEHSETPESPVERRIDETLMIKPVPAEPFIEYINGYPVAVVPKCMNEFALVRFLGQAQKEVASHIYSRHGLYLPPTAELPKHVIEDVCKIYGYLVEVRG